MAVLPGKSMVPLLSASTSLIMSCNSDSEGFWPRDRITVPSSLVVICPGCCSAYWPTARDRRSLCLPKPQSQRQERLEQGLNIAENSEANSKVWRRETNHHRPCPVVHLAVSANTLCSRYTASWRKPQQEKARSTYKKGEGLLELRDLLFGERIRLS